MPTAKEPAHRVLFVSHTAEWIGPNISLVELVSRLPTRLQPFVVFPGDGPLSAELSDRGIQFRQLGRLDKWGTPGLASLMRRERVSLVYGNSASGVSRNALIAAALNRLPFIWHLRETARPGRLTNRFLKHADAVIAVSRSTAASYGGLVRRPIQVVYNGIPIEQFGGSRSEAREQVRREFGAESDEVLIAHVGNVYARKGQLEAIDVFDRIGRPAARLLLVGRLDRDPAYVERVRSAIERSESSDRIHLVGFRADVREILCAADIFLHTASGDPHPRAVIEAMGASLPVVAIDVDGVGESVVDGETGFLVSEGADTDGLADRARRLVDDGSLRQLFGRAGMERAVQLFSASKTAESICGVIDGVLKDRGQ